MLAGTLALAVLSAPYRLQRFMAGILPSVESSWGDPYGAYYQASHVSIVLNQLTWFGGDTLVHLPRASTQLLPISLGEQWGGLAFAGVFLLMAAWLILVRPKNVADGTAGEYRQVVSRMLWYFLAFAAVDNACVNLLVLTPHGQGMPIFSGNWGLMVLAWVLMAINGQMRFLPARKWPQFAGVTLLVIAGLALIRQPPNSTEDAPVQAAASRALEHAMQLHQAEIGAVVVLDAQSGAILALASQVSQGAQKYPGDFNAAYQHTFAPGHTLAPILAAVLFERGLIQPDTVLDTRPLHFSSLHIQDDFPLKSGSTVGDVLAQSSRSGTARMALMLTPEDYLGTLSRLGLARSVGYAGEKSGKLSGGGSVENQALLGIAPPGGGIEVNLLQLAQAYLPLAGDGHLRKVFGNPGARPRAQGGALFQPETVSRVRDLLADSAMDGGMARLSTVPGMAAGGMPGTLIASDAIGGQESQTALFVGMAPLAAPRLVIAVMLARQQSRGGAPLSGRRAAVPVFGRIIESLPPAPASAPQGVNARS